MKLIVKEEFDKLTREEKIVAICKDVLLRIKSKLISPQTSYFFYDRSDVEDKLQDYVNSNGCIVCGKGAVFCSWVGNFNNIETVLGENISHWKNNEEYEEILSVFEKQLLDEIEVAFERGTFRWNSVEKNSPLSRHFKESDDDHRLISIMNHLIENGGKFNI